MGTDITSFLEVKSQKRQKWLVVGRNLTVEHFDPRKECRTMKFKFPIGEKYEDWRGYIDNKKEYKRSVLESIKNRKESGNPNYCPLELLEQDLAACEEGHEAKKETIVMPFEWRNYSYFRALSGCRDILHTVDPISKPKGLPEDMSDFVRLYAGCYCFYSEPIKRTEWGEVMDYGDYHHASWLTIPEIEKWLEDPASHTRDKDLKETFSEYVAKWLNGTVAEMKKFLALDDIGDVRVVFGFDS